MASIAVTMQNSHPSRFYLPPDLSHRNNDRTFSLEAIHPKAHKDRAIAFGYLLQFLKHFHHTTSGNSHVLRTALIAELQSRRQAKTPGKISVQSLSKLLTFTTPIAIVDDNQEPLAFDLRFSESNRVERLRLSMTILALMVLVVSSTWVRSEVPVQMRCDTITSPTGYSNGISARLDPDVVYLDILRRSCDSIVLHEKYIMVVVCQVDGRSAY